MLYLQLCSENLSTHLVRKSLSAVYNENRKECDVFNLSEKERVLRATERTGKLEAPSDEMRQTVAFPQSPSFIRMSTAQ